MKKRYLETNSLDPAYNLAFEEYVLTNRKDGDYLILWQNKNTVVIGNNQIMEAEVNHSFAKIHQIQLVRRTTGGGAVYHDLGNLNYSFITDAGDAAKLTMEYFTAPVIKALQLLGLNAETSGRNDILIDEKKVSGAAQRLLGNRILHHGTLLFDSDPEMISGSLNADPEKFRSKSMKSVRSRVGNIREYLNTDMDLMSFWNHLKDVFTEDGFKQDALSDVELSAVADLAQTKYRSWEWNFGRSPRYCVSRKKRFAGGSVTVDVLVDRGTISQIDFFGDFLSLSSLEPLTQALQGCLFRLEEVRSVLDQFDLCIYFGAIQQKELLETIFAGEEIAPT